MINFKNNKKSFSLIELLIALIIISLVVVAFIPLITKKMKANNITVGSFGTNKNLQSEPKDIRKEYCDKFNAAFVPAKYNGGSGKDLCVTKYNVGDYSIPFAKNTTIVNVGQACNNGNCCWKGVTAANYTTNKNADSLYSGQKRTVCQFLAGYNACKSYAPSGTKAGDWRLPALKEFLGWGEGHNELNANQGQKGLQLCGTYDANNVDKCSWRNGECKNATSNYNCHPYVHIVTTDINTTTPAKVAFYGASYEQVDDPTDVASSVRCVHEIPDSIKEEPKEELSYREPQSQADCDPYNALYIEKTMNGGKSAVCATKYNVGDFYVAPEVIVVPTKSFCTNKYCCWNGTTADSTLCTSTGDGRNDNYTYGGCYRTVCNWYASDISCKSYAPNGIKGLWRLPTASEISSWGDHLDILNHSKGIHGLQLCDRDSASKGSVRCFYFNNIGCQSTTASSGTCNPSYLWSSTTTTKGRTYEVSALINGSLDDESENYPDYPFSARCVTDKIPVK